MPLEVIGKNSGRLKFLYRKKEDIPASASSHVTL